MFGFCCCHWVDSFKTEDVETHAATADDARESFELSWSRALAMGHVNIWGRIQARHDLVLVMSQFLRPFTSTDETCEFKPRFSGWDSPYYCTPLDSLILWFGSEGSLQVDRSYQVDPALGRWPLQGQDKDRNATSMAWNVTLLSLLLLIVYPHDCENCVATNHSFCRIMFSISLSWSKCCNTAWWELLRIHYLDQTSIALQETIFHD